MALALSSSKIAFVPDFRQGVSMRRGITVMLAWITFSFTVFLAISCQRTPDLIAEGEVCHRCRRVITNSLVAGEILQGPVSLKYKTPGCMAQYVVANPATDTAKIFVTDYATGALIDARTAWYVPAPINEVTGERDYRAFHARRVAEAAAVEFNSGTLRWDAVLRRARG
jgi:hypothetical protein